MNRIIQIIIEIIILSIILTVSSIWIDIYRKGLLGSYLLDHIVALPFAILIAGFVYQRFYKN
jgi:hypothetical protein